MKGICFYCHMALALTLSLQTIKAQDLGISHFRVQETGITLEVNVPQGWGHVKLVTTQSLFEPFENLLASGEVKRLPGKVVFTIPKSGETTFLSVWAGEGEVPEAPNMGSEYFEFYPQLPTAVLLDEH